MRARYAALFFIIIAIAISVLPCAVKADSSMRIFKTSFIGMAVIPHTLSIVQTALRTGDAPTFQVGVHSSSVFPPTVSVDLSELGISSPTTTPAGSGSPNYNSDSYYNFGPLTISSDISDGQKQFPLRLPTQAEMLSLLRRT